jgi:hypothetical protein
MTQIKIEDSSGDKKYFTIIPNYILNHSTLWDREVYIQMKRITGEDGTCWTSQKTLAKQCGISINRLKKSIQYLVDHKWIMQIGKRTVNTDGGPQEVNEYRVADLWKLNAEYYEKKGMSPDDIPIDKNPQRYVTGTLEGMSSSDYKEEPYINNNYIAETSSAKAHKQKASFSPLGADLIKAFEEIDPKNKTYYNNKAQRAAADFLIQEFGLEAVLKRIKVLPQTNILPYFPKINSPYDLKEKWVKLESQIKSKLSEKTNKSTPNYVL